MDEDFKWQMVVEIDKQGRVYIPKDVIESMKLKLPSKLRMVANSRTITLTKGE